MAFTGQRRECVEQRLARRVLFVVQENRKVDRRAGARRVVVRRRQPDEAALEGEADDLGGTAVAGLRPGANVAEPQPEQGRPAGHPLASEEVEQPGVALVGADLVVCEERRARRQVGERGVGHALKDATIVSGADDRVAQPTPVSAVVDVAQRRTFDRRSTPAEHQRHPGARPAGPAPRRR